MSLELVELEYLTLNHDNCKLCGCPTCRRINQLRSHCWKNAESKYRVINTMSGKVLKFPTIYLAYTTIGVTKNTFSEMLATGDIIDGYRVERIERSEYMEIEA